MVGGHGHGHGGDMNLYATHFNSDFEQSDDTPIDFMVCECCPTSAVQSGDVTIVAYRDRLESEVRNINIIRKVNGEWNEPFPVYEDGWEIPGCPVNGPKLAINDGKIVVAWFTAPEGDSQIKLAFSKDLGATFSEPIRIDGGKPQGRVDLSWLNDKQIIASWLEADDENSSIVNRIVEMNGYFSELNTVETLGGGRGIGYPQIEFVGNQILILWTNSMGETQIGSKWITS